MGCQNDNPFTLPLPLSPKLPDPYDIQDEASHIHKAILHTDGTEEFLNIQDILYVENVKGQKQQLSFVLNDRKITCRGNLKDWATELEPYHFISVHRSILVNLNYIHYIHNGTIILINKTVLPISRRQEQFLKSTFARHIYAMNKE